MNRMSLSLSFLSSSLSLSYLLISQLTVMKTLCFKESVSKPQEEQVWLRQILLFKYFVSKLHIQNEDSFHFIKKAKCKKWILKTWSSLSALWVWMKNAILHYSKEFLIIELWKACLWNWLPSCYFPAKNNFNSIMRRVNRHPKEMSEWHGPDFSIIAYPQESPYIFYGTNAWKEY